MNFNNHGKSLPYNGFAAGSKLVLALGCILWPFGLIRTASLRK